MFHSHRVDVTTHIQTSLNVLGILFHSALRRGQQEVSRRGDLAFWNGDSSRLYVRKAQYHWGWDWGSLGRREGRLIVGPKIMTCGPWKDVRLEVYEVRIEEVDAHVTLDENLLSAWV